MKEAAKRGVPFIERKKKVAITNDIVNAADSDRAPGPAASVLCTPQASVQEWTETRSRFVFAVHQRRLEITLRWYLFIFSNGEWSLLPAGQQEFIRTAVDLWNTEADGDSAADTAARRSRSCGVRLGFNGKSQDLCTAYTDISAGGARDDRRRRGSLYEDGWAICSSLPHVGEHTDSIELHCRRRSISNYVEEAFCGIG